jgi:hypothetical protein
MVMGKWAHIGSLNFTKRTNETALLAKVINISSGMFASHQNIYGCEGKTSNTGTALHKILIIKNPKLLSNPT